MRSLGFVLFIVAFIQAHSVYAIVRCSAIVTQTQTALELKTLAAQALETRSAFKFSEKLHEQFEFNIEGTADRSYPNATFFNSSGQLVPEAFAHADLAVENGSRPLSRIRIHLHSANVGPDFKEIEKAESNTLKTFETLVRDLIPLLKRQPQIQLQVVFPETRENAARQTLVKWMGNDEARTRVHFTQHPERYFELGPWAQDDSKPLSSGARILVPGINVLAKQTGTKLVSRVLNTLAQTSEYQVVRGHVAFEGGNLVVGERHVFIGIDIVARVMKRLNLSLNQALKVLEYEFGKPIFPVGEIAKATPEGEFQFNQIDFHADLTVAVGLSPKTGKEVVFLASADAAVKVYQSALNHIVQGNVQFSQKEQKSLEDEITFAKRFLSQNISARRHHNDEMRVRLKNAGYDDVRELPSFRIRKISGSQIPEYINYINTVFSQSDVLVPQLGLPILDQAVLNIYKEAGFNGVRMIHSSREYLDSCGGPRCAMSTMR